MLINIWDIFAESILNIDTWKWKNSMLIVMEFSLKNFSYADGISTYSFT